MKVPEPAGDVGGGQGVCGLVGDEYLDQIRLQAASCRVVQLITKVELSDPDYHRSQGRADAFTTASTRIVRGAQHQIDG